MKQIVLLVLLIFTFKGFTQNCGNNSGLPTDNPVHTFYNNSAYPWTDDIKWDCVFNVEDYTGSATEKYNAARDDAYNNGGGVVYFPAGTYTFDDDIYLKDGVVIRGATPANNIAKEDNFSLPTRFEFPKYDFTTSGSGTDNATAFKNIKLENADDAGNLGIVYIDINRAGVLLHASHDNATGENLVVFGIRTNNVGRPDPGVPNIDKGQKAWQRYCYRFTNNLSLYNHKNILVANTRHNDNITDNFNYTSYWVNDGGTPRELQNKVTFNYTDHYVMHVGSGESSLAGTPETAPGNFREGIVIRDNWMFHTMRVAMKARGWGLQILDNVIRDQNGKEHWTHPAGVNLAHNSQTLENRAIDWGGYDVVIDGNDYEVYRHKLKEGPYYSVDGEGILLQECCGGTLINGVRITNNTGNAYIGLYKVRDIHDAYIAGNTLSGSGYIYVNANTNGENFLIKNSIVENNTINGTGDIIFYGDGGHGSGNFIRNNTGNGGAIKHSCLAHVEFDNNSNLSVEACEGGTSGNQPPEVSITEPSDGSTTNNCSEITITAEAGDTDGSITKIDFYNGNTFLGSVGQAPYTLNISDLKTGNLELYVVATDDQKATTVSERINVTVDCATGIVEHQSGKISVFPNPASDQVSIRNHSNDVIELVSVYNLTGQNLFNKTYRNNDISLNLNSLEEGVYFLKITTNKGSSHKKILVKTN